MRLVFRALLCLILTGTARISVGQDYPQDYFEFPLEITPYISGTFGEIRFTHFHAGLDIKTNQQEGLDVLSSADGYVARIKVSTYGYGRVLYVKHPNGYTTVYAHLKQFNDEIQGYVDTAHYTHKRFYLELFPEPGRLQVKQGEVIALSGNTGGSGGPHLHFEIRDGAERPLNPLLFGITYTDNISPFVGDLTVYDMSESRFLRDPKSLKLTKSNGKYITAADTLEINSDQVGFSIHTYDQANGASNKNGVFTLKMMVDDELYYEYQADRFSFDEQRFATCAVDYRKRNLESKSSYTCFAQPGNKYTGIKEKNRKGLVKLSDDKAQKVNIEIADYFGNISKVQFFVKGAAKKSFFKPKTIYYSKIFYHNKSNSFNGNNLKVSIPSGALFDTLHFNYGTSVPLRTNIYSNIHYLHDDHVPLFKNYQLAIKPYDLPYKLKSKAVIVRNDWENDLHVEGGNWDGDYLVTKTKYFGEFYVMLDTIPPSIKALNIYEGKNMASEREVRFKISDNLTGIDSWHATIDGEWVLMEFEHKKALLYHQFREKLEPGEHKLVLTVTDDKQNKKVYTINFKT